MPKTKNAAHRFTVLLENCRCTPFQVTPENWETGGASVKEDWQIWYRFHDPIYKEQYPHGRLIAMRGMNHVHTLGKRRDITRQLLALLKQKIIHEGFNPIRNTYMKPRPVEDFDYIIPPDTPMNEALDGAFDRICQKPETHPDMKVNLRSVLKYFKKAAIAAMQDGRPMGEVKRRHIVMCWDQLAMLKAKTWSNNQHNYYRAHMKILFQELYKIETIEVIPLGSIPTKEVEKKQRETLTMDQRRIINVRLKQDNYRLWLLTQIFFHSGARTTELLAVKASDVDLQKRQVKYIVKKGRTGTPRTVYRPIKNIALDLWVEALQGAEQNQYLFSEGLIPGDKTIRREQITRRWRHWVKDAYGITADWYSLKHANITEVTEAIGNKAASELTQHTSTAMIDQVYDIRKSERESEAVREVTNAFA